MNENEEMLEEELTETVGEDAEEVESEETAEAAEETEEVEESEEDFEYDDEGNIVIPEDNEEEEESSEEDDTSSERDVEAPESGTSGAPSPTKREGKEEPPTPDPRDEEIARLKRELADVRSRSSEALKKIGGQGENPVLELEKMAAETEGISVEEYNRRRENAKLQAEAQAAIQNQRFEQIAASDLAELHAAYPETRQYKHVRELPDEVKRKFGEFRDKGLTAKQAYAAADPDGVRQTVATAVKKQAQHDSKSHLKSSVPKGSKDTGVKMTRSELAEYREMFPHLSDKEINDLYKKANR